jgi:diacylglycerol kinase (ATP)
MPPVVMGVSAATEGVDHLVEWCVAESSALQLRERSALDMRQSDVRATVVVSAVATRASRERLGPALEVLRSSGWLLRVVETKRQGHATEIARDASGRGDGVVVAAGGDGTINEVAQALVGTETALGALPLGLENVWAKEIGLGGDLLTAARRLVAGERRRVDVGLAGERYFLMMASLGIDTLVARKVTREAKRRWGELAYVVAGLGAMPSFRGADITVTLPDGELRRRALLVLISNTRLYAGRVYIADDARADDGLFDVCLFNERGFWHWPGYALGVMRGRSGQLAGVERFRAAELRIDACPPWPVQFDGDVVATTPVSLRVLPRALSVIVPREAHITLLS